MRAVDRLRGPWGLVALLLTLLAVGGGVYALLRGGGEPSREPPLPEDVRRELSARPPSTLARDPKAAEEYVRRQTCVAGCASVARVCAATAIDDEAARVRCETESRQCQKECR